MTSGEDELEAALAAAAARLADHPPAARVLRAGAVPHGLAWSGDGRRLAALAGGKAAVWEVPGGASLGVFPAPGRGDDRGWLSATGRLLLTVGRASPDRPAPPGHGAQDAAVVLREVDSGRTVLELQAADAWLVGEDRLVVVRGDARRGAAEVAVHDARTGERRAILRGWRAGIDEPADEDRGRAVALCPALVAARFTPGRLTVTHLVLERPDGRYLAAADSAGEVTLYEPGGRRVPPPGWTDPHPELPDYLL